MARIDALTLGTLSPLREKLREIQGLTETRPGIFYVKRVPMLHFHQTAEGIVADLKRVVPNAGGFDRYPLDGERDKRALLAAVAERCRLLREKGLP